MVLYDGNDIKAAYYDDQMILGVYYKYNYYPFYMLPHDTSYLDKISSVMRDSSLTDFEFNYRSDSTNGDIVSNDQCIYLSYLDTTTGGVRTISSNARHIYLNEDISNMFRGCINLVNIGIDTDSYNDVTNMACTYYECIKLVDNVYVPDSVTNMSHTFHGCKSLIDSNISSNVTDMSYTFYNCSNVSIANVGDKVTNLVASYYGTNVRIANCTDSVIDMNLAYLNCYNLVTAEVGSNVANMCHAYKNCSNLLTAVSSDSVIDMSNAYYNCINLTTAAVGSNVTTINDAFSFTNVTTAVVPKNVVYMVGAYKGCSNLATPVVGSNVINMHQAYADCNNLETPVTGPNVIDMSYAYSGCNNLTKIIFGDKVTNLYCTYAYCNSIRHQYDVTRKFDLNSTFYWSTRANIRLNPSNAEIFYNIYSNVDSISYMLGVPSTPSIDFRANAIRSNDFRVLIPNSYLTVDKSMISSDASNWQYEIFRAGSTPGIRFNTTDLSTLGLNNKDNYYYIDNRLGNNFRYDITNNISNIFNNDSIVNMYSAFSECNTVSKIIPIIAPNVVNLGSAYLNCELMSGQAYISNKATDISYSYTNCRNLTAINEVSDYVFDNMSHAFDGCTRISSYPIMSKSVTNASYAYNGCISIIGSPNVSDSITNMSHMYDRCNKLIGDPLISNNAIDASYAYNGCYRLSGNTYVSMNVTNLYHAFEPNILLNINALDASPSLIKDIYNYNNTNYLLDTDSTWHVSKLTNSLSYNDISISVNLSQFIIDINRSYLRDAFKFDLSTVNNLVFTSDNTLIDVNTSATLYKGSIYNLYGNVSGDLGIVYTNAISMYLNNGVNLFNGLTNLGSVNFGPLVFDTDGIDKITNVSGIFNNCSNLTSVSGVMPNTITDISYAFNECSNLTQDISTLIDTSNVIDMDFAFNNCSNLTGDYNSINLTNARNISHAFYKCNNLTGCPRLGDKLTRMSYAFYGCNLNGDLVISNSIKMYSYAFGRCNFSGNMYLLTNNSDVVNGIIDSINIVDKASLYLHPSLANTDLEISNNWTNVYYSGTVANNFLTDVINISDPVNINSITYDYSDSTYIDEDFSTSNVYKIGVTSTDAVGSKKDYTIHVTFNYDHLFGRS